MAKQTDEQRLEALKQAIAEQQATYNKFVVDIEKVAFEIQQLKEEKVSLESQKQELTGEVNGLRSTLNEVAAQVEDYTFKREALESQILDMEERIEGLAIGKKEDGPKPGMYLKDNRVHIPGFGLREKDKGPLTEPELKAFYSSFDTNYWSKKDIIKKFLIEVVAEEED